MKIIRNLFVATTILASSLAFAGAAPTADEVGAMIAEADSLRKQAKSLGFEWRDTSKFIGKAKQQLADGKLAKAMKTAKHARLEGSAAIAQAKYEDEHWQNMLPK